MDRESLNGFAVFLCFRNFENTKIAAIDELDGVLDETGERVENSSDFARMLQPVASMAAFGLIAHQLGEPQRAQYMLVRGTLRPIAFAISPVLIIWFSASRETTAKATGLPISRHSRDCL
jgi:hypothetical protein